MLCIVSFEPMMSMSTASTFAVLSCFAVSALIIPEWIRTVKPRSRLICAIVGMNFSSGTAPFGRHPPLIKQPNAPFSLSAVQWARSFLGVFAGCMVSRTFPPQCLQFSAQPFPVMDIVGKSVGDDW